MELFAFDNQNAEAWQLKFVYLPMKEKGQQERFIKLTIMRCIFAFWNTQNLTQLSCMSSLREISRSKTMWNFLLHDTALSETLHLYLLRTHESTRHYWVLEVRICLYRYDVSAIKGRICLIRQNSSRAKPAHLLSTSSVSYLATAEFRSDLAIEFP